MNKKWLVLDCDYLCHRVAYSMGSLNHKGEATGIVYGFLKYIPALQDLFDTSDIVFCWDSKTSKRRMMFPEYKANRYREREPLTEEETEFEDAYRRQVKLLRTKYLKTIGYRNVFQQKGYESDDIIASICLNLSKRDEAIIVTCDKDLYQLIRPNVSFYDARSQKVLTFQGFKKQYGITPREWKLVKAIAGCSTDNVPGIRRVGEKTAIKYLKCELGGKVKVYQSIVSGKGQRIFKRNYRLVALPLKGTKTFKLRGDELSEKGWKEVTKALGMKSIRDNKRLFRRRR